MKLFKLPDLGEGLPDAIIREWYIQPGDTVTTDQPLVAMETAKALVDVPAPFDGMIEQCFGDVGDTIMTGDPLIGFEGQSTSSEIPTDTGTVVGKIETSDSILEESTVKLLETETLTTPGVRAIARRRGINLTSQGTHKVRFRDIKSLKKTTTPCPADLEPLSPLRRAMIASMEHSHQTIVPVTLTDIANISAWYGQQNITLRLLRAMVSACEAEPMLNATFDETHLAYKKNDKVNIGLAVDTPHGLYVPVLHDVAALSDTAIREKITTYKEQAMTKSLPASCLQGGTISFSNFGTIAGRYATPIIIPPMVAILGIGKLYDAAVPDNGNVVIHKQLPISLTVDHRLITGGETARFLAAFIQALQNTTS